MAEHTVAEDSAILLELTYGEFERTIEVRRFDVSDVETKSGHLCLDMWQHLRNVAARVARLVLVRQCVANLRWSG